MQTVIRSLRGPGLQEDWRSSRAVLWMAAAFAIAVALIPALTGEWQQQALAELSGLASRYFAEGGLAGFALGGASAAGWGLLLSSNALIIIAAWFALESEIGRAHV